MKKSNIMTKKTKKEEFDILIASDNYEKLEIMAKKKGTTVQKEFEELMEKEFGE